MKRLTEAEETERGNEIVELLHLKQCRDDNGKRYNPPRYDTRHGTKTALGLYRTLWMFYNLDDLDQHEGEL